MIIRNEEKRDYKIVESMTRKAFYNLYIPGCVEHYLVHRMREHQDFIKELDFVIELDGQIIGNIERGIELGYDAIVIFGSPVNYVSRGFKSCKKYNVSLENGKYPAAMMVKELIPNVFDGRRWFYKESPVMAIDEEEARQYDSTLEKIEKKYQSSQDEFYIMSHAFIE